MKPQSTGKIQLPNGQIVTAQQKKFIDQHMEQVMKEIADFRNQPFSAELKEKGAIKGTLSFNNTGTPALVIKEFTGQGNMAGVDVDGVKEFVDVVNKMLADQWTIVLQKMEPLFKYNPELQKMQNKLNGASAEEETTENASSSDAA